MNTAHGPGIAVTLILLFLSATPLAAEIFVDQVGYLPNADKYVFSSAPETNFEVVDAVSGTVVFSGEFGLWKSNDPATGLSIYRGEFTNLQSHGNFQIRAASGDVSTIFTISDTVYRDLFKKSLKGYYFQRCGTDLLHVHSGDYGHPRCHRGDGFLHPNISSNSDFVLSQGGWHDAGDFGKYVVNAGITVGTLLLAYESFPERFTRDDLSIPESGNQIPDILDEVRYKIEWLLTMQTDEGGVYHKLTRERFSGFVLPQNDSGLRYIYGISTTATGNFAAVMARAARVFLSFDADFANRCRDAALLAWDFLQGHPLIFPWPEGFKNPEGTNTGEYGDGEDTDERLWAAAELYATTDEERFLTAFLSLSQNLGLIDGAMSWQDVKAMAYLTFLFGEEQAHDGSGKKERIRGSLISWCESAVNKRDGSGLHVLLAPGEYVWGSNSVALNKAILLLMGFKVSGEETYLACALDQLHYVLGINVHGLSFVTGVGERSPINIHHRQSVADGIEEPIPGLLAGGANQYLQDGVLASQFDSNTPPARTYVDHVDSYASNEIAINWNAPLVLLSGFFSTDDFATTIKTRDSGPNGFHLFQNYPNPFNPDTEISFFVPTESHVVLKLFNPIGQEVRTILNSEARAGEHKVHVDATDLPSGIYFYQLRAGDFSQVRKMTLLR